jgi:hypothetical protein
MLSVNGYQIAASGPNIFAALNDDWLHSQLDTLQRSEQSGRTRTNNYDSFMGGTHLLKFPRAKNRGDQLPLQVNGDLVINLDGSPTGINGFSQNAKNGEFLLFRQ